jgi:hypothetical protein
LDAREDRRNSLVTDEMCSTLSMHGTEEKFIQISVENPERRKVKA